jgi:putative inorganic carbon (hco3(-)) transporter
VRALILSAAGILIAAGAAAATIVLPPGRPRAAAMLLALALFPLLILGDQWNTAQITDLRDEPPGLIALALLVTAAAVLTLAAIFRRWPILLPLAIIAALPFRVPLEAGGDTANLLVPLYLVVAAGVLTASLREWQEGAGVTLRDPSTLLRYVLAAVVLLYALQALYSPDFSKSLQNVCFFFVPFSLVFALLRDLTWDKKLLVLVLWVVAIEAVVFVFVGSVEWVAKSLFWNDHVIRSNEFHTYFRVNSVFWDPNIYGRYLALAAVVAMSALLWATDRRTLALLTALVAVLWLGLVPSFSQSSFAALLGGLAILAAIRWSWKLTLAAVGAAAVLGVIVVIFAGGNSNLTTDRLNVDTGGRSNLITGGVELFAQRPLWGYGSGSFPRAYREHVDTGKNPVSVSHTEPVTVAAEQGLVGLLAYASLLLAALWTMSQGLFDRWGRGVPPGQRRPVFRTDHSAREAAREAKNPATGGDTLTPPPQAIARIATLAAFTALLVHTMAYAGFYEDPIAWVLLAVGASLGAAAPAVRAPA